MWGRMYFCLICIVSLWSTCHGEQVGSATRSQDGSVVNYAKLRSTLSHNLPEKANEFADFIDSLQEISKATLEMTDQISAHCAQ